MPATVTLPTATLAEGVTASADKIKVSSTAGMVYGTHLYLGGELMKVIQLEVDPWVKVTRGVGGPAVPHSTAETIYIGRADQFYSGPPVGRPDAAIPVSPYIDATNGRVYWAQGDITPSASAVRWWQEETTTRTSGPLGITTTTLDPTSST